MLAVACGCGSPPAVIEEDGVVVTGRAATLREARVEAIVAGVRLLRGEYVDAEVSIRDDTVIRNEIRSFANAPGVTSVQLGEPVRTAEGEIEVKMRVMLDPSGAARRSAAAPDGTTRLAGGELVAEGVATAIDRVERNRLVSARLATDPATAMEARVIGRDGRPSRGISHGAIRFGDNGVVELSLLIEIGFDEAAWSGSLRPAMDALLAAAARRVHRGALEFSSERSDGRVAAVEAPVWAAYPAVWGDLDTPGPVAVGRPTMKAPWPAPGRHAIALLSEIRDRGQLVIFDVFEVDEDLLQAMRSPERARRGGHGRLASWAAAPIAVEISLLDSRGEPVRTFEHPLATAGGAVETIATVASAVDGAAPRRYRGRPWFFTEFEFTGGTASQRVTCGIIGPWFVATEPLGPSRPVNPRGGWTGPRGWPVAWRGPAAWFTTAVQEVSITMPLDDFERAAEIRLVVK